MQRGHSGKVYVDVQNDGLSADTFKVKGASGAHGFGLTYFRGTSNVSSQVNAGTFSTGSLAPGGHVILRVVIKVASASYSTGTFLITARSSPTVPVDAVKAIVHAT